MKYRINENLKFEEQGAEILVIYPGGFRMKIPGDKMSLINAFDPPAYILDIKASDGMPEHTLRADIGKLQDLIIIVPDDDLSTPHQLPFDLLVEEDNTFREILRKVRGYTMGTPELCYALFQAVKYIHSEEIDGAIVETGVWRGGNIALCALTLMSQGDMSRDIYMFDTFDWSWPDLSAFDTKLGQGSVAERSAVLQKRHNAAPEKLDAQLVSEEQVCDYLATTGYPTQKIHAVKGLVQDTIPENAPEKIALLRLDTDFYESTYHELVNLYPRLVSGGILLVDDYPTERGCVKAVEQYFAETGHRPFLNRIHTQGRIAIKP